MYFFAVLKEAGLKNDVFPLLKAVLPFDLLFCCLSEGCYSLMFAQSKWMKAILVVESKYRPQPHPNKSGCMMLPL
jgi:hypothetical protein